MCAIWVCAHRGEKGREKGEKGGRGMLPMQNLGKEHINILCAILIFATFL